jgi:hypothetical protein
MYLEITTSPAFAVLLVLYAAIHPRLSLQRGFPFSSLPGRLARPCQRGSPGRAGDDNPIHQYPGIPAWAVIARDSILQMAPVTSHCT